ncbi:MAG TPA: glutathione S-transferase family protein [Candidatus Acidoferrales bacterium]|nr:glutathione S-transferase family protein [Candidatus Acidoferrales bacterium]
MANDLTVWGVGTSRTIRAHWMLMELGLDYQFHPIRSRTGETLSAEFLQLNPRHKIPVLRHGSFVLTESAAIVQYLSETFAKPDQFYLPADARSRATLNEWCYFIMCELDAGSLYVMRRHDGLREIYGDAPVAVESAREYFLHNLEAMAPRIASGGRYLFGERLSTADILLMTCLVWADIVGIRMSKTFAEYQKRVAERPAFKAAMQRNFAG